ncbi:diguanylate cyclase (GGDEF)-like protein [Kineococcus xinjiangensis]|uniref:Diguanylate cyclase (GGDEF)-like protein n=1 Tax=Kineococcus xinjiangensis TaxID=512762 RepID=A0A2S6IGR4_9ACTN|nr:diguanylate cyclase [Kineococcus xinjiangensis]PPK93403.1 diguanylate cyclase (GGDEF)-like protein [Kineococcus xinjiangensis]
MFQWQPLALPFAAAAIASLLAARIMWRRREETPAVAALVVTMLGLAQWSGTTAIGMSGATLRMQVLFLDAIYPGVCAAVAGVFCHALAMSDRRWAWSWRRHWWLLVEPVLIVVAVATNPWHRLFRDGHQLVGDPAGLRSFPGPLFWVHTYYSYALLAAAAFLLLRGAWRTSRVHRRRFLWPVLGGLAPAAGNVVSVWLLPHGRSADLTSIFFLATAGACWWALQRSALPDVLPVAFGHVVETIDDAVLVVDCRHRIVQLNPAAEALLRRAVPGAPRQLVGMELPEPVAGLRLALDESARGQCTLRLAQGGLAEGTDVDVRATPLTDARGACIGWVLVARDVTESLRLRRELAEQALRDPLTGLFNRRRVVEALEEEVPAALAAGRPVSVLLADVDRFKAVNDTHGHAVGDALLVAMARALTGGVHPGDLLARFGGEEFVAVLVGVDLGEALERAEDLRRRCGAVEVPGADGARVRTTISVGVAGLPGGASVDAPSDRLLSTADAALYAAKAGGRDRVITRRVRSYVELPAPR